MDEVDYEELERYLREAKASIGLGVACESCSAMVPADYTFGKVVYHPAGRPCGVVR